jgi:hypothetical protein
VINKTKLKLLSTVLVAGLTALSTPVYAASETMMNLLSILRDKGSISQDEYDALVNASMTEDKEAKKAAAKSTAADADWTSKIKIKGDMRLRYQYQDKTASINRDRGRIRYRLGVISKPIDHMEVGAGLASGGSDPRSTNQTFDNAFSTKGIQLDYAYVKYQFTDSFSAIGGKFGFKKYLWNATDLMWDGDINPEGFSANYNFNNALGNTFVNGGIWVIDETGSSVSDPFMGYAQLGQHFKSGDNFATLAGTYYRFADFTAANFAAVQAAAGGVGNTDYAFTVINGSGEIGRKNLFGNGVSASLFGDYVKNTATSTSQDTGFSLGAKLTNGTWTLKYIYADLDANAVPDFLPDSDRYDGATNMKGHEVIAEYKLFKNTTLGLDYYNTKDKTTNVKQNVLQADVVVKF